jgi:hypothetical protein
MLEKSSKPVYASATADELIGVAVSHRPTFDNFAEAERRAKALSAKSGTQGLILLVVPITNGLQVLRTYHMPVNTLVSHL